MKIDSASIGMESARTYQKTSVKKNGFSVTEYGKSISAGTGGLTSAMTSGNTDAWDAQSKKTGAGEKLTSHLQTLTERMQSTRRNYRMRSGEDTTVQTIRFNTIQYIFEQLFGNRRKWLSDRFGEDGDRMAPEIGEGTNLYFGRGGTLEYRSTYLGDGFGTMDLLFADLQAAQGTEMRYISETYDQESETTSYSTTGTVKCADGRVIDFGIQFEMSRDFETYAQQRGLLSQAKLVDPLVINLDTNVASVSDQTFYFDIDADGELDEISQLGAGSGFLALDKDGNGKIDDGSELFGTASGDGFADLARYDGDGNGWIDESDEIWSKLRIWTKDSDGNDVLYSLAQAGVGAICLRNIATNFSLTDTDSSAEKAQIRSSGVFLYENGNVGTVQHVDFRKFEKEA